MIYAHTEFPSQDSKMQSLMLLILMRCIFVIITSLPANLSLKCGSQMDLSSCNPGGYIAIFDNTAFTWVLQPNEETQKQPSFLPEPFIEQPPACGKMSVCQQSNVDLQRVTGVFDRFPDNDIWDCLNHYCETAKESLFCFSEDKNIVHGQNQSSSLSIKILNNHKAVNILCSIEMSINISQRTIEFVCNWPREYCGINSTITIPGSRNMNETCSGARQTGVKIENISPWSLFLRQSKAKCVLSVPNLSYQPMCNTSLYIDPWIANISLGESVELKCLQNLDDMKWWKITGEGTFLLNTSDQGTIVYDASDVNETEVIIICGKQFDGKDFIAGIGKVVVGNYGSETAQFLDITTTATCSPSTIFDPNQTLATDLMTTSITHVSSGSLVMILVLMTTSLMFSLTVCLLLIKNDRCSLKKQINRYNIESEPQYDTIIMKVDEPESG